MRKQAISLLSLVILVLFVAGCGGSSDEESPRAGARPASASEPSASPAERDPGSSSEGAGLPRVTLIEPSIVGEGYSCEIVVRRTGSTGRALTVRYQTGGTAVAGTDYVAPAGSIVIPAGSDQAVIKLDTLKNPDPSSKIISFTLTPDAAYEVASSPRKISILDAREKGGY